MITMLLKILGVNNDLGVLIRTSCVSFGVDRSNNTINKGAFINDNGIEFDRYRDLFIPVSWKKL